MVLWEKGYLERSEKASKEKAYRQVGISLFPQSIITFGFHKTIK